LRTAFLLRRVVYKRALKRYIHLWQKARVLDGLFLPENVHLREF
jgi:hypothetical protein